MRATWRPLPAWPYPPRDKARSSFEVSWAKTITELEKEIELLEGSDVVIGVVALDDQFRLDGTPKAGFTVLHNGAEVGFDTPTRGRLIFHTDAFGSLQENLRAISLGLTALRAIKRYGITSTEEQYAGFAQLTAGGPDPARGKRLVDEAGGIAEALKVHHPDHGGSAAAFADVQAYRKSIGAAAR